jgi:glycosyltransferase involved in cell wall biosynthesis
MSAGFKGFTYNFNKALVDKGIEVDFFEDSQQVANHDYPLPVANNLVSNLEVIKRLKEYDYVMLLDHGIISTLPDIRRETNAKFICQILDCPSHLFNKGQSYYEEAILFRWQSYVNYMRYADYIVFNQQSSQESLADYHKNIKTCIIPFPVNPIYIDNYERKNYVLYIGRNSLDKGVYNLINAMALVIDPPKLVAISNGPYNEEIEAYAKYMRVNYENVPDCPEVKKWQMLHECLFTVMGGIAPNIPPLLSAEGISIGRTSICFDFPEYRRAYQDFVHYVKPFNALEFADTMRSILDDIPAGDAKAKPGIEHMKNNRSYAFWADELMKFIG